MSSNRQDNSQLSTEAAPAVAGHAVANSTSDGHCYAAVIENRAKEVGVAVLDLSNLKLHISQSIEPGRSYTTTQLLLDAHMPQMVVIVGTQHQEVLGGINQAVASAWDHTLLPRSCFDDTKGILAVQELTGCSPRGTAAADSDVNSSSVGSRTLQKSHYLGFGAAGALLHYVKQNLRLALAPRAVQVDFKGVSHHMSLERDAVSRLELLAPSKARAALQKAVTSSTSRMYKPPAGLDAVAGTSSSRRGGGRGSSTHPQLQLPASSNKHSSSLFGFLNYTSTTCGARLLRTNLLQPLIDITTLELRLDSLQELLESPHLTLELMSLMDMLPKNLDKVCSNLAVRPSEGSSRDMSLQLGRLVSAVILLRDVLRCLPVMADSMAWVDGDLLRAIRANLANGELQQLLAAVEAVLDDDAQASKTQFVNKVQQCFAVRAQVDSFLDVSRATFSRLTEAIHELAAQYRNSTGIAGLKVQYSSSKGFYLVVPHSGKAAASATDAAASGQEQRKRGNAVPELPRSFLVLEKRGRASTCVTTHELNALNSRLRDAANDCMMLTVQVLEKLVSELLAKMPLLLRVLDNIALLDMLLSFFQAVTGSDGDWCRPRLSSSGPLVITKGRHPLLQALYGASASAGQKCVPNDTYISPAAPLHLVTGPNMSGKSTYLKQVALLVLMAQVGCYVPASFMSFSPYESLHTRIGTADSIEANASSFMVEMADMAHIMDRAGARSLVLIDELGRATSTSDGVALCWAMSEYLLALGAHTLLATHFRQLHELAAVYPNAKLWQMQVGVSSSDINFTWKIAPETSALSSGTVTAAATENAAMARLADPAAAGTETIPAPTTSHYGILLGKMVGLPTTITDAALQIAMQLDAKQQQRQQQQQADSNLQQLRQVYSLVHKLGCVAREATAAGAASEGPGGAGAGDEASVGVPGTAATSISRAAVASCLPIIRQLKLEAEQLLLAAAQQPSCMDPSRMAGM